MSILHIRDIRENKVGKEKQRDKEKENKNKDILNDLFCDNEIKSKIYIIGATIDCCIALFGIISLIVISINPNNCGDFRWITCLMILAIFTDVALIFAFINQIFFKGMKILSIILPLLHFYISFKYLFVCNSCFVNEVITIWTILTMHFLIVIFSTFVFIIVYVNFKE